MVDSESFHRMIDIIQKRSKLWVLVEECYSIQMSLIFSESFFVVIDEFLGCSMITHVLYVIYAYPPNAVRA